MLAAALVAFTRVGSAAAAIDTAVSQVYLVYLHTTAAIIRRIHPYIKLGNTLKSAQIVNT